ncbi:MAG: LysR family transcriptional regulator, partial [Pseudobdellovibrionaceae bacterium]
GAVKDINHRLIIKKPVSIFGSNLYKKLRKNFPGSLSNQQFILPTIDSKLRYDFEHWAKINSINLDIIAETQDVSLKKLMAIDGLGLIPAAPYNVQKEVLAGQLIEVGSLPGLQDELYLVSANRKISNPVANILMKTFSV